MNILITGANGQLGNEMRLLTKAHDKHTYFLTDIAGIEGDVQALDITDRQAVADFVAKNEIELIVNCAAYTNVDKAEEDEATAMKINAEAVENLGLAAAASTMPNGCHVIHISTDYVFSGEGCTPYREEDEVAPATAYGRTKLEGERRLLAVCPDAIIIRTAWLYSSFGNNFVKTMMRLGKEKDSLGVVFDQIGTPTYAEDLAVAVFAALEADEWHPGIYHFTNEGVCSWYDFTMEIHKLYNAQTMLRCYQQGKTEPSEMGLITCEVRPIRSEDYNYKTPRPHYSVLDKKKFRDTFNLDIPYWPMALARCMQKLA